MMIMFKARCSCGAPEEEISLISRGVHFTSTARWYQVKCDRCGKSTAKHTDPDAAVMEWNEMNQEAQNEKAE